MTALRQYTVVYAYGSKQYVVRVNASTPMAAKRIALQYATEHIEDAEAKLDFVSIKCQ